MAKATAGADAIVVGRIGSVILDPDYSLNDTYRTVLTRYDVQLLDVIKPHARLAADAARAAIVLSTCKASRPQSQSLVEAGQTVPAAAQRRSATPQCNPFTPCAPHGVPRSVIDRFIAASQFCTSTRREPSPGAGAIGLHIRNRPSGATS